MADWKIINTFGFYYFKKVISHILNLLLSFFTSLESLAKIFPLKFANMFIHDQVSLRIEFVRENSLACLVITVVLLFLWFCFLQFQFLKVLVFWNIKWKIPEKNNSWVFKSQVVLSSMMKSYTILLAHARGPHSPTLSAPNIQPSSSSVVQDHPKQIVLLLTYSQKVKWSLTPSHSACHSPHSISSCRHFIISRHHKEKGGYSRIR